jgi:hypothetical protein
VVWRAAVNGDGTDRLGAQVVELGGFTGRGGWPAGGRLICRRENPHPGASLSLFDQIHGRRHTRFLTNSPDTEIAGLELRHRRHARVEDRIRTRKTTGATRQPYWDAPANEAWLNTTLLANALLAWAQLIGFDGDRARRLVLRRDAAWPWAEG